jgi:8-oxo-dGTP pyrophosphatase MutT (NUDIX family)
MDSRPLHRITNKVALYSLEGDRVLVMKYLNDSTLHGYGLPGGHLEEGEDPNEAVLREVKEELGFIPSKLQRRDFFVHQNGKLVLGFIGKLSKDTEIIPANPDYEFAEWKTKAEFKRLPSIDEGYRTFVLDNWDE